MKNNDYFLKTFPIAWIFTAVVSIIFFLTLGKTWGLAFILGSASSLMAMSLLYKNSKKILNSDEKGAQRLAVANYALRLFIYAAALVISGLLDSLEILATALGLLSFKFILYIHLFIGSRGEN